MATKNPQTMLTLEAIQDALTDANLAKVAKYTRINRQTVHNIVRGHIERPKYHHVKTLSDYVETASTMPALQFEREGL